MSMPKLTLVYGLLLVLLGVGAYVATRSHGGNNMTALLPSIFGVPFLLLGVLCIAKPGLRKHLMHAAAGLALLLAGMGLFMATKSLVTAGFDFSALARPVATVAQAVLGILSVAFVLACVNSFIQARKARQADALAKK
jgi:hypothetical protein